MEQAEFCSAFGARHWSARSSIRPAAPFSSLSKFRREHFQQKRVVYMTLEIEESSDAMAVNQGNYAGALLLLPLKTSRLRTQTARPSCSEQPATSSSRLSCGLKVEKAIATNTIGRTAAQASVSGLGIQNRYGPDHEVVLATIEHTIYNRCV